MLDKILPRDKKQIAFHVCFSAYEFTFFKKA